MNYNSPDEFGSFYDDPSLSTSFSSVPHLTNYQPPSYTSSYSPSYNTDPFGFSTLPSTPSPYILSSPSNNLKITDLTASTNVKPSPQSQPNIPVHKPKPTSSGPSLSDLDFFPLQTSTTYPSATPNTTLNSTSMSTTTSFADGYTSPNAPGTSGRVSSQRDPRQGSTTQPNQPAARQNASPQSTQQQPKPSQNPSQSNISQGNSVSPSLSTSSRPLSETANTPSAENTSFVKTIKDIFNPEPENDPHRKRAAIIPANLNFAQFQVPTNQVTSLFKQWINERWFAPAGFMSGVSLGQLERHLVPYWLMGTTTSTTTIGKCCFVTHQPTDSGVSKAVERWSDGKSVHIQTYSNVLLLAYEGPNKDLFQELKPFDHALAKHSCAIGQVPNTIKVLEASDWSESWSEYTESVIKKAEITEGKKQLLLQTRCSRVRELRSLVTFTSLSRKLIYLPIYQGTYVYEGMRYVFLIHGLSGQVVGQRPYGFGALGEVGKNSMDAVSDFFHDKMRSLTNR